MIRWSMVMMLALLCTACEPAKQAAPPDEHGDEHKDDEHGAQGHGDELALSEDAMRSIGLTLADVEPRAIGGNTLFPARVELEPNRTAHISAPVEARFARVDVVQGQRVKAGDLLALVRAVDTAQIGSRAAELRAELVFAKQQLARQEQLGQEGVGASRQLEEAQATTRRLSAELAGVTRQLQIMGARGAGGMLALTSPIDGIIVQQHALLGEEAGPEHVSFVVSDPSEVWIVGQVPELLVSSASDGASVVARLHAWPESSWSGKLDYIAPALDAQAHTLPVRMTLKNPDGKLKAGMFGTLELLGDEERPLTAPASAVLLVDGAHTVFVPEEGEPGRFKPVGVEVGRRSGDLVEIKRGLSAGQKVVTQGAFTLKSLLKQDELGEGHAH